MQIQLNPHTAPGPGMQDQNQQFHQQCLRVLACTAQAMLGKPGSLRFWAGSPPWLDGFAFGRQLQALDVMAPSAGD